MALYYCEASNIFIPRNDWNIKILKCKRKISDSYFIDKVAEIIEDETGINPYEFPTFRKREFVQARQILMVIIYEEKKRTLRKIGEIIGKDHATVLHAKKTIKNLCDTDKDFKIIYERIKERVKCIK